ncbi:hypothetical protein OC861_003075 [Tilletia horrida]|nr:hypothetical protein OC861_003075 [Tilletia horrida]
MAWPPPQAQVEAVGNMAGFGARKMQEEQHREAQRQHAQWEKAEAERRQIEYSRQLEVERQTLEQERQRIAWEWSELQRQQREHEEAKVRFQQEQAYAAEQQRLQSEAELQRIQAEQQQQHMQQQQHYLQQQQQFEQQQQQLEQQQEQLQRQQQELQQQHQSQQAEILEQQKQLKKAEIEVQRKLKAQALAAQKLKEEQVKSTAYIQEAHAEPGDDTLHAIQEPLEKEESRPQKSTRPRQRTPSAVQSSVQRTKIWAAEHAETMMVYCADCRQDVVMTQLENHHCMRRNNSDGSSQESLRAPEISRSGALSADSRTPSPGVRTRSPFFERHQELERARDLAGASPHSPSLSPIWPNTYPNGRSNSHDGGLLIRRTPSEDERERLISTPSPIPPDLSPEEEAAIRAERKRRIELQREAKKNGGTSVAATAIIAALKFESLAKVAPNRTASPSPMSARDDQKSQMLAESSRPGLPKDKFPSSSSLASTQSSLLSAGARAYARDRAYSGSSAAITPSTSYEFSNANTFSPDPSTSSRSRTKSSNSQKEARGVRARMDSEPTLAHLARSRMDSDPLTPSRLRLDTTIADEHKPAKIRKEASSKRLDLVEGLRPLQIPDPISTRDRSKSVASRTAAGASALTRTTPMLTNSSKDSLSPSLSSPAVSLHPEEIRVRNRSGSLSPLNARRPLLPDNSTIPQRKGTSGSSAGTASPAPDVDLRGIEDLMRGLESDEMLEEHRRRRAERQRTRTDSGGLKPSTAGGVGAYKSSNSPQLRAGADLAAASIRQVVPSMPKTGRIR